MSRDGVEPIEALLALRASCTSYGAVVEPREFPDDGSRFAEMDELSQFARHLVDLCLSGDAEEFPSVFEEVDRLLVDGDQETMWLVRTNLLEDIQNICSHRDVAIDSRSFRDVLGPEAQKVWDELEASWSAAAATSAEEGRPERPKVEEYLNLEELERRRVQAITREMPDGTLASPSDVLRYESGQLDDSVDLRRRIRRARLVIVVLLLLVVVIVVVR